jgi:alanyl-tRNA synthetase
MTPASGSALGTSPQRVTERLYYTDSFVSEFDAQVLACEPAGDRFRVLLDRTAFYPTSGGQPHDTGRLDEATVEDVFELGDGRVAHVADRQLVSGRVRGAIDWPRRFDHIQQHTGQHLLSAAFLHLFRLPTVAFHLGREVSTIDLAGLAVVPRQVEEAERLVNQVVWEDRPLTVQFGTAAELAEAGMRKAVERKGTLRVIDIEGFDRQPCGGTHASRTGQVGMLLVRKLEKQKQNWRVEFVCGGRALTAARSDFAALSDAAQLFSCGFAEVPAMVARALEKSQASRREGQRLVERLAELEAQALAADGRVIVHVFEDADAGYLRLLAARLVAKPGTIALLATRAGGHVVFAQSSGSGADMNVLLQEMLSSAGGKGGGSRDFAQGTVPGAARLEEFVEGARQRL